MRKILVVISVLLCPLCALAQSGASGLMSKTFLNRADSLRSEYSFEKAIAAYEEAMKAEPDSTLRKGMEEKRTMAQNALTLTSFVSEPTVVARHAFSLTDFFLFFPLEDQSWVPVPNKLDSQRNNPYVKATYFPKDAKEVYYSAMDEGGCRNIYYTTLRDTLWTPPALLNEGLTSAGDEIYPMLSPDGKSLYFASSGLYGIGGYDLYVATWDEDANDWNVPVNMGFPYSSPADDFLYINSPDGKYTVFASNRDCAKDSVYVYVLEFDNVPIRKEINDSKLLKGISRLLPSEEPSRMDNSSSLQQDIPDNVDTRNYVAKMKEVRALQDSISVYEDALEQLRGRFAMSEDAAERTKLSEAILESELLIPGLQDSLSRATRSLQKIEMDFLFKGVVLDPEKLLSQADREVVGASSAYAFTRQSYGKAPVMEIAEPERKFDYSFMILPEGRFAEDNNLPEGLVYQIQISTQSSKASVRDLKGLSPVFEWHSGSKYVYRVGVFRHYNDALENLNSVKKAGFRDAIISAFKDGNLINVTQARKLESDGSLIRWKVVINTGSDDLPTAVSSAIRGFCEKDVIRVREGGKSLFVVASFIDKAQAQELADIVKVTGINDVTVKELDAE